MRRVTSDRTATRTWAALLDLRASEVSCDMAFVRSTATRSGVHVQARSGATKPLRTKNIHQNIQGRYVVQGEQCPGATGRLRAQGCSIRKPDIFITHAESEICCTFC
jgi:hypothetical protein